jgi:hypothetical protein
MKEKVMRAMLVPYIVCVIVVSLLTSSQRPRIAFADGQLVCQAGRADTYATADGTEYPDASGPLLTTWGTLPAHALQRAFDDCERNEDFVQTLSGCALDSAVTKAVLTLHVKGTPQGETYNDLLILGSGGTLRWGVGMSTLESVRTGGNDAVWSETDSATFVLDLGNLPPSEQNPSGYPAWAQGTTNILPFLAAGHDLDIVLRDDTCVDFLTLEVFSPTPARQASWGELKVWYR